MVQGPGPTDADEPPSDRDRGSAWSTSKQPGSPSDLRLTIVDHGGRPDRATVHPPGLTGIERMETWLSTNASVVVDLGTWR